MAEPLINYPNWVADDTSVPNAANVFSKRLTYTMTACNKLLILHNAAWKWLRDEPLTPMDEQVLAEAFPGSFPGNPPSEETLGTMIESWWKPRNSAAHAERARLRHVATANLLPLVDLNGLI